jgi:hypothetical protein
LNGAKLVPELIDGKRSVCFFMRRCEELSLSLTGRQKTGNELLKHWRTSQLLVWNQSRLLPLPISQPEALFEMERLRMQVFRLLSERILNMIAKKNGKVFSRSLEMMMALLLRE